MAGPVGRTQYGDLDTHGKAWVDKFDDHINDIRGRWGMPLLPAREEPPSVPVAASRSVTTAAALSAATAAASAAKAADISKVYISKDVPEPVPTISLGRRADGGEKSVAHSRRVLFRDLPDTRVTGPRGGAGDGEKPVAYSRSFFFPALPVTSSTGPLFRAIRAVSASSATGATEPKSILKRE